MDIGAGTGMDVPTLSSLSPLLIANRGEIAARIARTAHDLGLRTVAVCTAADRGALHTEQADVAVRVGSYLDGEELIGAARRSGARAVHPGYGFLSENASFAARVREAGLVWVGPAPETITLMGDKGRAKQLAERAGVPVVPGTAGEEADAEAIAALAGEQGFPIVIKALAGGGGKGMRVVRSAPELEGALGAARREAESAFGDGRVLAERYLERPRHIEVQVLADSHGAVLHLGERECSLQRRHQKVIEEAPSPVVDAELRERIGAAAVDLARACDYEGAGTVEFIVPSDASGFYFLEMNTRLQVEHPVTEMVWEVDLVEQQLRVAAGEPLDLAQEELHPRGHAVEARLYSEDPAAGFLPAVGTVRELNVPTDPGVRVDLGIARGAEIGTDYDPMLAKLIAHGPDRATAIARLDRALADLELLGVAHNAAFSRELLARPDVLEGRLDTGLLERALEEEALDLEPPADLTAAAAFAIWRADTEGETLAPGPWRRRFEDAGEIRIGPGWIEVEGERHEARARSRADGRLAVELEGIERGYAVAHQDGSVWVGREGRVLHLTPRQDLIAEHIQEGSLEAPMPGKVLSVAVSNGDQVGAGDVLMILESMKMELQITAPEGGVIEGLELAPGDQVGPGQILVAVVPGGDRTEEEE